MVYVNGGLRRGGEILHTGEAASTPPEGKGGLFASLHTPKRSMCMYNAKAHCPPCGKEIARAIRAACFSAHS